MGALRFRRDFLTSCRAGPDQPTRPEPPSPFLVSLFEFGTPLEAFAPFFNAAAVWVVFSQMIRHWPTCSSALPARMSLFFKDL